MFITITNNFKTEVVLCTVGASICDIKTRDYSGNVSSIMITPDDREKFATADSYFGKTIGRTGGRIANNKFILNGKEYTINSKDPNGLHGGIDSLSFKEFKYNKEETDAYIEVEFSYLSKDMESGYPGNLDLKVIYRLYKKENKLELEYRGISDEDTLLNLSNHAYFNLNAESGLDVTKHNLYINSSRMEKIENLLPTKIIECPEIYSFKKSHKIKDYLFDEEIIKNTNGYDYPYIFDDCNIKNNNIILVDEKTKRILRINTTYPVVVVYTCNYCEDIIVNNKRRLSPYDAICLECMYYPNSINSDFINNKLDVLKKYKIYNEKIIYNFDILER